MSQFDILALDRSWNPHQWLPLYEAMILEAKGLVLDHLGTAVHMYRGGVNNAGNRSELVTSSIIVIDGEASTRKYKAPTLTNPGLFQRDMNVCAYCGSQFHPESLTRDHYHPQSKGGKDTWMNCVTACKPCNALKGDLLPGAQLPKVNGRPNLGPQGTGKMEPLYVPYVPCRAEHMILRNRVIKTDQMQFLLERVKNPSSRIFEYVKGFKYVDSKLSLYEGQQDA